MWRLLVLVGLGATAVACDRDDGAQPAPKQVVQPKQPAVAPPPTTPPAVIPPTNPPALTIAATYPCLYAAIRDGDYRAHPAAPELIPKGRLLSPRNPSTGRLLELDTSAGGGYACCEAGTFYAFVDRQDSVLWIADYHASFTDRYEAWFGPFALCPQRPCTCPTPPKVAVVKLAADPPSFELTPVREFLEQRLTEIQACYRVRVSHRPKLAGTVDLQLAIADNPARVESITPDGGALRYDHLFGCAMGGLANQWLQTPSKKPNTPAIVGLKALRVTLSFTPPDPPLKPIGETRPQGLETSDLEPLRTRGSTVISPDPVTKAMVAAGKRVGFVVVTICVSPDGRPSSTNVQRSSGSPSFDRLVERTAMTWRFRPILIDREPLAVCSQYSIGLPPS
jgi:TonB family protein